MDYEFIGNYKGISIYIHNDLDEKIKMGYVDNLIKVVGKKNGIYFTIERFTIDIGVSQFSSSFRDKIFRDSIYKIEKGLA